MHVHGTHNVGRDSALVEHARAVCGDGAQRRGVLRVDDALADRLSVVNGARRRIVAQVTLRVEQRMQAWRERKAVLCEIDRGAKEFRPRQAAVAAVGKLEHAQHARHADRAAADHRFHERHRLPVTHEAIRPRRFRRRLASVIAA